MAPSKIQITTSENALSPCATSPQLMPFHIAYSGPAPMATFFRVQELEEQKPHDLHAPMPPTAISNDAENPSEEKSIEVSPIVAKLESLKRFVAAFRGRRVVGLEVPLPEGYTGLVLRSDVPAKNSGQANKSSNVKKAITNANTKGGRKASTRRTRRSKAAEVDVVDVDAEEQSSDMVDLDDTVDPSLTLNGGADGEVKTLKATQTFQSLLVWNADVAVDVGRDEYIRSLREWTSLAAEIHRTEE